MRPRLLLLSFFCVGQSAMAQTLVWDPGEIARLAAQRAQIALALSSLAILQQQVNRIAGAVGASGARAQPGLTPLNLPNVMDQGLPPSIGQAGLSASATAQNSQWLRQATSRTAVDGLALAAVTDQILTSLSADSDALSASVSASQDLRGDIAANSAIALALVTEAISVEAMIALTLQQHVLKSSIH